MTDLRAAVEGLRAAIQPMKCSRCDAAPSWHGDPSVVGIDHELDAVPDGDGLLNRDAVLALIPPGSVVVTAETLAELQAKAMTRDPNRKDQ